MNTQLAHFHEVLKVTPWATQTNAKRQIPELTEDSPLFCKRARGAVFWDMDERPFTDYFCSCGPIILGHADDRVDNAVRAELENGFLFSIASDKEYTLAKRIVDLFPAIDWVKYMKTGGDAMAAAVRLARVHTRKYTVLQCGYHGWQDWYQSVAVGAGREYGIPEEVAKYTVPFPYGDIDAVEELMNKTPDIAAVVLVPYDWTEDLTPEYFSRLRALCDKHGALLIFDEVKCGFRVGLTGVQGTAGIMPDITVFAKSICNGYPLSVLAGRAELLKSFDNNCFVTTTYAGETLSIVAALATIDVLEQGDVYKNLSRLGLMLKEGIEEIAKRRAIPISALGRDSSITIRPMFDSDKANKEYAISLMRSHLKNGQYVKGFMDIPYVMCDSHTKEDISKLLETIDSVVV